MMAEKVAQDATPTAAVKSARSRCPLFPVGVAVPAAPAAEFAPPPTLLFHSVSNYGSVAQQAEAQYRVSFSRARQKRGPPSLLS